jgi:hypothetical protein
MNPILQTGHPYTIIYSNWMAVTYRKEITITGYLPETGKHLYKTKGKRTIETLTQKDLNDSLVFEDHALPVMLDSETDKFSGNCMFNFVTAYPDPLRHFIREKCVNPSEFTFQKILYHHPKESDSEGGLPLFPEKE